MKRLFLLICAFTMLAHLPAASQDVGIKGGGNVAMLRNASNADAVLYFHGGIYLRERLVKKNYRNRNLQHRFYFQPELVYSRQGASLPDQDLWIKNDYVNLGLIFQYMPLRKVGVEFGPQAGYLVNHDITTKYVGKKEKVQSGDRFRKMDYALCFGLLYDAWGSVGFSFRYNLGLNDIIRHNQGKSVNNGVLQVSMNILLW